MKRFLLIVAAMSLSACGSEDYKAPPVEAVNVAVQPHHGPQVRPFSDYSTVTFGNTSGARL